MTLLQNWKNPHYLQQGNQRQKHAYSVLEALALWPTLRDFDPVVAGTIPLAVDVPESDLDILCQVLPASRSSFEALLRQCYQHLAGFQLKRSTSRGHEVVVCRFSYDGLAIELFGQALPSSQQYGFRHMLVEAAILQAGGETWRRAIHHLKQQGLKTEPAFAQLLHLPGDPYEALLTLEGKSSADLAALVAQCSLPSVEVTSQR